MSAGIRAKSRLILALILSASIAGPGSAEELQTADLQPEAIEARLLRDVTYLASDELEGRGARTKGLELAADYIAREFTASGLKTDLVRGTPFQEFTVYSAGTAGSVQALTWRHATQTLTLTPGKDYTSLMATASGNFQYPLTYVGFGITAPERHYDDYANVDVRGHAVIVLRHEPRWRYPPGTTAPDGPTEHAYLAGKIRNAVRHGAAAILLVTDLDDLRQQSEAADQPAAEAVDVLLDVELSTGLGTESLPVVHVRRSLLSGWLQTTSNLDLTAREDRIHETLVPQSVQVAAAQLEGRVALTRPGNTLRNVLASLEGTGDLKQETIIVGAHYDHLGRGGWGSLALHGNSEIHNGADDNASGTAILLEAARQLSQDATRRRRILFIAFTGEELGLYGSKRYIREPLVPLDDTLAMLNLDMVGRLRERELTVYGVGTADVWPVLLGELGSKSGLRIAAEASGFGPSDHAPFHEQGVPVLHFFTGFHPEYHRPPDDVERLNIAGMRDITTLLVDLVRRLDATTERPRTVAADQPFELSDSGALEGLLALDVPGTPRQLGVGLEPVENGTGLKIAQVLRQSTAERLGLLPGDVLLQVDGQTARDPAVLARYLQGLPRRSPLTIEFSRGGITRKISTVF